MNFLKKKLGPLPAWAWGLIIIALIGLVIWYRRKQTASSSSTTASTAPSNSIAISCTSGVATCPAGYEDDGTGTCNCVLISSEGATGSPGTAIPATTTLTSSGTCPPGYQLDPTGTFCQVVETPATSAQTSPTGGPPGSITMPAGGCPIGYTPDPTGAWCVPGTNTPGPVDPSTGLATATGTVSTSPASTTTSSGTTPASTATSSSAPPPSSPAPAPAAPAAVAPPASMDTQAAAAGLCEIDAAEAKLAFAKGLTVWVWDGTSFGSGTKGPTVPTGGQLFGECASLAAKAIPHAGA